MRIHQLISIMLGMLHCDSWGAWEGQKIIS